MGTTGFELPSHLAGYLFGRGVEEALIGYLRQRQVQDTPTVSRALAGSGVMIGAI
jgi:hypothetical protein